MTTKITIEANCPDTHVVNINIYESGVESNSTLQNGETEELFVHDNKLVSIREIEKSDEVDETESRYGSDTD